MKTHRLSIALCVVLAIVYVSYLSLSAGQLPTRVASHFDFYGRPNGWMSRQVYLLVIGFFGLLFPLLFPAILFASRFVPIGAVNLPHKEYWLSADRRAETQAYLFRYSLWLTAITFAFTLTIHYLVVQANAQTPPTLSSRGIWGLLAIYLAGTLLWAWGLIDHFRRPPTTLGSRSTS